MKRPSIAHKRAATLLNPGSGFLTGYSHTLNPYGGCSFACSYCYVRRMPVALFRGEEWGTWIDVKTNAPELLRKELRKARTRGAVTIFMSSSTDPYQPAEQKERITRSLLEVMAEEPPDFLLVQTRSPLVARDIDLLQRLGGRVRVSMTVETDLEEQRRHFTPQAPPIPARLRTLRLLADAGVPTQAAIAPMLPSSARFPAMLREVTERVCLDDYFMGDGSGGKRTRQLGIGELYERLGLASWYRPDAWRALYDALLHEFPEEQVLVSQRGFDPC